MNKKRTKRIHFVGIKGVGMTPLAIIAKQAGFVVTGSDVVDEFITDKALKKAGINIAVGFSEEFIVDSDLVITTGAHGGLDNPQVVFAKHQGIEVWTQGEAVGKFMDGFLSKRKYHGISIAGAHGKTTTTAMIATILTNAKKDPSYVIGTSEIFSLGLPGHFGRGEYFVAEADEYATDPIYDKTPKFLWQHPKYALFTNIEFDHPDLFENSDAVERAFLQFAKQLQKDAVLFINGDDARLSHIAKKIDIQVVSFGYAPQNTYRLTRVSESGMRVFFHVASKDTDLGEFSVGVAGEHNAKNALSSIAVCLELGLSVPTIKEALKSFVGSKRRMEYIGTLSSGALVYDDYAHHPTEIKKSLRAIKQAYPNKRVVCIFQPHTYSRTKSMFEDFLHSFTDADTVLLLDIYASQREIEDKNVSSQLLATRMEPFHKNVVYAPDTASVVKYVNEKTNRPGYIIITMGAGDVYKLVGQLPFVSHGR